MKIGIALPQRGPRAGRDEIVRVARAAEEMGLDSVWVIDRLLRPVHLPMPDYYANVYDPIETLTYVAALTERVLLGTSAINALLHPPLILARRLATLDQLSGGRVLAGLSQGWMAEEFEAVGVPMSRRGEGMAEYVAALRTVWGADPVEFKGRIYQIPASQIGPKPVRPGGVPILISCSVPDFLNPAAEPSVGAATRRAGRIGAGLNIYHQRRAALELELTAFCAAAAGSGAAALPIVVRADGRPDPVLIGPDRALFSGTIEQWADDAAFLIDLGIDHVILDIDAPIDDQLALVRRFQAAV